MKKFAIIMAIIISTQAQCQVLNGSFELSNAPVCNSSIANSTFNSVQLNITAFGIANQLDLYANFGSCGYGTSQHGDWFVGMGVDITGTLNDAFAFHLGSPLLTGNTYLLTFYQRTEPGYSSNIIDIGVSNIDTSFGTTVFSTSLPATLSWLMETAVFTAPANASYLTVQVVAGAYGWNMVDNFVLTDVTGIEQYGENNSFHAFPNPATSEITVVLPVSFKDNIPFILTDIQGRILRKFLFKTGKNIVDVSSLAKGIYFLNGAAALQNQNMRFIKE